MPGKNKCGAEKRPAIHAGTGREKRGHLLVKRRDNMSCAPQDSPVPADTEAAAIKDKLTSCLPGDEDQVNKSPSAKSEVEAYSQSTLMALLDW
jgi:hypothetical protein